MQNPLRNIPSVNELLDSPPLQHLVQRVSRNVVVTGVRDFLDNLRGDLQSAAAEMKMPGPTDLAERIAAWIVHEERPVLRPVINATGILLHTGLGRAPMADEAVEAVAQIARGYGSLEVRLDTGERSQRIDAVQRLLRQITGAEAAFVVNNNAGATLLALAAVAATREVIVSRGHLIEIGGSYRLPDVMQASGAILREVGTTNKTRISDFRDAINTETGALLRVHPSNFLIKGFTEQPTLDELVALGRKRNLPLMDDIGSGALVDFSRFGINDEPIVGDSLKAGADLVLFSGDKLLGGPQCGIILGRRTLVAKVMKHPLARALRIDKMTLAALAATLRLYQDPQQAEQRIPLLSLLTTPIENLKNRAERLAPQLAESSVIESAVPVGGTTFLGGGSVPTQEIPTWCVALKPTEKLTVDQLAQNLRIGAISVFGRIQQDQLCLDLRTVFPHEDVKLVQAVADLGDSATIVEPSE